ncbi:alpha/beta hydrolase [Corynebacterium sp. NML130628]|uniref:alpha/beta hydrolase n=1 Tax=Corynebacterium sp. NML130628 TaxID=1906333 RepID=UPI0008FB6C2B|nr:alpha/beta hydrolase [Corynebacterium sp. NML130628]OIR43559.1 hypothetical protein BJP07_06945 [Corynebacterium sp. NML130628]
MSDTYRPALDAGQLMVAAGVVDGAVAEFRARSQACHAARSDLVGTGFRGEAPTLALRRLQRVDATFAHPADDLTQAAQVLRRYATWQARLDAMARSLRGSPAYSLAVQVLNGVSRTFDTLCAAELEALCKARERDLEAARGHVPLIAHHGVDLGQVHRRNLAALDPARRELVTAVGATVLEAGPASATLAVGNVVDPARVITMVAGVSTGRPEDLGGELARAQFLAERTGATVILWQGYDPPPNVVNGLDPGPARRGADDLSAFQLALSDRFPNAHRVVLAHSYGTRVATEAALHHGLLTDQLWLVGSAGVAGTHVSDLRLAGPDSRVVAVDSPEDPILWTRSGPQAVLGASPTDPAYGARVLPGVSGGHGDYFTDETFVSGLTHSFELQGAER